MDQSDAIEADTVEPPARTLPTPEMPTTVTVKVLAIVKRQVREGVPPRGLSLFDYIA